MTVLIKDLQRRVRINKERLRRDTKRLLSLLQLDHVEVSILIVNDKAMKNLNKTYRKSDKATDVLSFPMYESLREISSPGEILLGDIVINAHLSSRIAEENSTSTYKVIQQLLVHGLLHLIGYDHEKNAYQKRKMLKKENHLCNALT